MSKILSGEFRREIIKTFKQRKILVVLIIFFLYAVIFSVINAENHVDWKKAVLNEIQSLDALILENAEDEEFVSYISDEKKLLEYQLEQEISPAKSSFQLLYTVFPMLSYFLPIICMLLTSTVMSNEYEYGTFPSLNCRPIKRTKTMLSKELAVVAVNVFVPIACIVIFLSVSTIVLFNHGFSTRYFEISEAGSIVAYSFIPCLLQDMLMCILACITYSMFALTISIVVKREVLTIAFSLFVFFFGGSVLPSSSYSYLLFPCCADNLITHTGIQSDLSVELLYNVASCLCYVTFFFGASILLFETVAIHMGKGNKKQ